VLLILAVGAVLGVSLGRLQLVESQAYVTEARNNVIRARPLLPARGAIRDRHGRLLAGSASAFTVTVTPYLFDVSRTVELADVLGLPDSMVAARVAAARAYSRYATSPIASGLTTAQVGRLSEEYFRFRGIGVVEGQRRVYSERAVAPFVLGTLGEIGPDELADRRAAGMSYHLGDIVGITGMERAYEEELRGRPGVALIEVDVHGRERGRWRGGRDDRPAESAYDLTLTLDAGLQALAEHLFVNKRGAAVAIDPRNGEVLAYVSAPAFTPADLAPPVDPAVWSRLTSDPARPLFDRAALSAQPLGSTIKPFEALAGLSLGTLEPTTTTGCGGAYVWGGHVFRDHGAHGHIGLQDAISRSCNVYFFRAFMGMPFQSWTEWGHLFGFGQPVPTDLPGTGRGLWPDSAYFDRTFGAWTRGYLVSLGIGQGDLGVTPLQLARYAALLANGGTLVSPHFARELRHPETGRTVRPGVAQSRRLPIAPPHMALVREAMLAAVERGTARRSRIEGIAMAGKTGTAENPHGEDHALFIGFAPYDAPTIAVAVLVENAGFGSVSAAPIASLIVERHLTGRIAAERRPLLDRVLTATASQPTP
jgi:penicillin-binding protein 2